MNRAQRVACRRCVSGGHQWTRPVARDPLRMTTQFRCARCGRHHTFTDEHLRKRESSGSWPIMISAELLAYYSPVMAWDDEGDADAWELEDDAEHHYA